MGPSFQYNCRVVHIVDGDTLDVDIDLGFFVSLRRQRLRLARVDTPEIRGIERPQGLKAKARVAQLILGKEVVIHTTKKGKYGRYLAEVYYQQGDAWCNLSDTLLREGLAERYR